MQPTESRKPLILSAIAFGLATSCSILGVFNGIAIAVFYAMMRRFAWRDLLFIPIAIATFFATSIIYLNPALLLKLIRACALPDVYPFWNYLGLGSPHAPWYFSLVVFVIKIGLWWLVLAAACYATTLHRPRSLQTTFLASFEIALLINFALKGFVFRYDAPHHQVQFYPLVCLGIAAVILEHRLTKPLMAAIAICFAIQLYDVIRFFPNYLFYGAQYGDRFIGEFYGPAVMHGQDRGPVNAYIDTLIARDPNVKILVADNNALERPEANFVPFTKRDPAVRYEYAFVDRLFATHVRFPERDAYNAYLAAHYVEEYTYYFPTHKWMYRVLRNKLNPDVSAAKMSRSVIPRGRADGQQTFGITGDPDFSLTLTARMNLGNAGGPGQKTYATANPTCAAIIIRYICRHDGWFSVAVNSSGLRTISQTV
jgi:hypothetical protein